MTSVSSYALPGGDLITHPALVGKLVKPGADIIASLSPEKADAWHMASCIPGEAGELFDAVFVSDLDNIVEELGDLEFYLQGLRAIVGIDYAETVPADTNTFMDWMALPGRSGDVFDAVKKWVIYSKPLDRDVLVEALTAFERALAGIRDDYDITREETLAANVMKLGTRYESLSYSDAAAQQRADKVVN